MEDHESDHRRPGEEGQGSGAMPQANPVQHISECSPSRDDPDGVLEMEKLTKTRLVSSKGRDREEPLGQCTMTLAGVSVGTMDYTGGL